MPAQPNFSLQPLESRRLLHAGHPHIGPAAVLGVHAHRIARTGPAPLAVSPQADAPTAARSAEADAAPEPRTRVRS